MTIKVQALEIDSTTSDNICNGMVVESIDIEKFNLFYNNEVFDAEKLSAVIVKNKTVLKYGTRAIAGIETFVGEDNKEVVFHYVLLNEYLFEIIDVSEAV